MLEQRTIELLYASARHEVEAAMDEVTIDFRAIEMEIRARTLAEVLDIPYKKPIRRRSWRSK